MAQRNSDRVPPHSAEAEQSVLGACLISREALALVAEIISEPSAFYRTAHQMIFESVLFLYEKGEPVDLITLTNELRNRSKLEEIGGVDYLTGLIDSVPTAANAEYYAGIVKNKYTLRNLIAAGMNITYFGYNEEDHVDEVVDRAEQEIFALSQKRLTSDFVPISDVISVTFEKLEELYRRKAHVTGVPSGFKDLDYHTAGFQRGNLIIVAARPSMGKTAICLNMAQHIAIKEKLPVAIFSLEMPKEDLAQRFLCSEARVDGQKLKTGHLQESDWPHITRAIESLSQAPIYIDDTGNLSVMEIRSKARRLKSKHGIEFIIIDYLQQMRGNPSFKGDRNQEISDISRQLKALSKELNVPVLALSQLNRGVESRNDKRPMLSDLRESGSIEQDADLVLFIYRDSYYNPKSEMQNRAEVIIAKHRNGPLATINLMFLNQFATFVPEEKIYYES